MTEFALDRLRALLVAHSARLVSDEWLVRDETRKLLNAVRVLATDADPRIRRQTWDALDLMVDDGDRDDFYELLIDDLDETQFRTLLTDTDPTVRTRVRWANTGYFNDKPFGPMALDLLADDHFDYAWPECIEVLRRPIHFDFLVGALADVADEGVRERLLVAFGLPATTGVLEISPELLSSPIDCSHPRQKWVGVTRKWCEKVVAAHQCKHLPIVVALLGSSIESAREEAMRVLPDFGPGTADLVRSLRRSDPPV